MTPSIPVARSVVFTLAVGLWAAVAAAQPAVYAGGGAFTDIKRFGSSQGYSGTDNYSLDGTSTGGSLRIGTFLNPRWTLELSVDAAGRTRVDSSYPYVQILTPDIPVRSLRLMASTQFTAVSTTVGYHPPQHGRVRLGYFAGFSFIRGVYKTDYPYGIPVPLFEVVSSTLAAAAPSIAIYPPPDFRVSTLTQTDNARGAVLGFEASVDLTRHLAIVPEVRALTFSAINNGPGVFLIRPGVTLRWGF